MIYTSNPSGFPPRRQPLLRRRSPAVPIANYPATLADLAKFRGSTAMPLVTRGRPMEDDTFLNMLIQAFSQVGT